ncbi:MAG: rod shape-determining protein MreC [Acidobacteriota bacterium]
MKQLVRSKKELVLLAVALFVHLVLLSSQSLRAQTTPLLRSWSMEVAVPLLKRMVGTTTLLSRAWYGYIDLRNARRENRQMRELIAEYRQEVVEYQEKLRAIGRLDLLEQVKQNLNRPGVIATIVGADSTQWYGSRIIDKGEADGVSKDCAVLTADGVVGRVMHVAKHSSVVQLISDSDSGVGVILENSRAQGVLRGTGSQEGRIDYIGTNEKVVVAEKVLTSGLDQIYPKGLLVAYVRQVQPGRQVFQHIEVTLAADLEKMEEVLVLKRETEG